MLGAVSCGRGVLSMSALSYGVIRVDQENSLTSLTLQDCGQIMPGGEYTGFSKWLRCAGVLIIYFPDFFNRVIQNFLYLQDNKLQTDL